MQDLLRDVAYWHLADVKKLPSSVLDALAYSALTSINVKWCGLKSALICSSRSFAKILAKVSDYYNGWRPHVSLGKDAPDGCPIDRFGDIVAHSILGGLHHRYARI